MNDERVFWRIPAWQRRARLRVAAIVLAVALLGGIVSVAVITHDTKTAAAATTCPSTDLQYYRDRHWAPCLWGTEHFWAAGLYKCTIGDGKLYNSYGRRIATFVSFLDPNRVRACQDVEYNMTEMANPLKSYYLYDLYKLAVAAQQVQPYVEAYMGVYENWFRTVGTGWPYISAALMIPACDALVNAAFAATGPYGLYYGGVACAWGWRKAFDAHV